ncbi:Flagellar assembly protein FliH [Melioribacter roseus P3M-2]|uniref:Flagellar assembly protein FliH n=1 Tax=Melioribacter roseus (strain DSM 23840 / JCM 17771 / VKM B-2668 / P3M-2) TaxID=1191523 RepID=I7A650_MELRP|nr:FliH/SctL family protein [Melioribacter roseus]AFN75361.1 Flagellar assembly protein FliH [Melioribacter roseus P3M-2]
MSNVLKINAGKAKPTVKVSSKTQVVEEVNTFETGRQRIEEAYNKGFEEGRKKARMEIEKDYSEKLFQKYEEIYHVLTAYEQKMEEYETAFELLVVNTAVEIARKIVRREVETESLINDNLKNAISKIIGANEVIIKLNPEDKDELNEFSKSLLNNSSFNKIKFEADERIEKGGCLVETEIGNVDARISSQLEEIRLKLEESINKKNQ